EVLVDQMVGISGARTSDSVVIAGCRNLDLLLRLSRRGFTRLACLEPGAPRGGEEADVLWLAHAEAGRNVTESLASLRRHVHCGGKLVIQAGGPSTRMLLRSIETWLATHGYAVLRRRARSAGFILCAEKAATAALRHAA